MPNTVIQTIVIVARDIKKYFKKKYWISELLFLLKGSAVITAPLLLQRGKTNEIFGMLNFTVFESSIFNDKF